MALSLMMMEPWSGGLICVTDSPTPLSLASTKRVVAVPAAVVAASLVAFNCGGFTAMGDGSVRQADPVSDGVGKDIGSSKARGGPIEN